MKSTTLHLHTRFIVDKVDQRIFGGFLEHLGRAVYEGVYDPGSKFADADGCRTDVLDALRRLKFTAMRYPGGNFVSGYHWQDAVGPRDKRPTVRDLAWQSIETNQFGPNEFIDLCKKMDWTPMMAVNLGTGTPEEARNWLEYCNIEGGSKWADLRREHGWEKPHGIKLWCLGNEMDGFWQIGHVPAENYAVSAQQTARMMLICDPTVELVACGSCAEDMPTYLKWDRTVLEHTYDEIRYLSLHRYVGNPQNDTAEFLGVTNSIDAQIEGSNALSLSVYHQRRAKRRVFLSFDEWNIWYRARHGEHLDGKGKYAPHLLEEEYNLEDAMVAAGFLNSFIRHADSVKIANIAQIVNVIAPMLTRGDDLLLQSIFYPIEIIAKRGEGISLIPVLDGPSYETKKYGNVKNIDASAILNGDELSVFLVNRDLEAGGEVEVRLADQSILNLLSAECVSGTDPKATNTFEKPNQVISRDHTDVCIANGKAKISLAAMSVYAGTFKLG